MCPLQSTKHFSEAYLNYAWSYIDAHKLNLLTDKHTNRKTKQLHSFPSEEPCTKKVTSCLRARCSFYPSLLVTW